MAEKPEIPKPRATPWENWEKIIKGCKPVIKIHKNRIISILFRTYSA